MDASRASSGSISRTIAQTAAIRAARAAESALLRSASSWSMASATRRRADSSLEHTVEDYQVDGVCGGTCQSSVIHRKFTYACGKALWIITRKSTSDFFFHTAAESRFPCLQGYTCDIGHCFHSSAPRLRTTKSACQHTLSTPLSTV